MFDRGKRSFVFSLHRPTLVLSVQDLKLDLTWLVKLRELALVFHPSLLSARLDLVNARTSARKLFPHPP
jgi:hypothetical protein